MTTNLIKPDPPVVGKVTHHSIELMWSHIKEKIGADKRLKYTLQEIDKHKHDWGNVYAGFGITKIIESLDPSTEYSYRVCYIMPDNQRSEYSAVCTVKTTKEPINGEALQKAIFLDRRADVEKICESPEGRRLLEIPDKFGHFPLMIAANKNNLDMVELLISHGAEVNAQNESGKSAIMFAAFSGKLKIVQELRMNGASYEIADKSGSTAVHYAVDGGNADCLQWMLLDGANANVVDIHSGWTPLIRAASLNASKEIADTLIKFGADVNAKDKEHKTALMISIINGNQPFLETLVERGANINFTNDYGKNALELAVAMDRRRVVKYLEDTMQKKKVEAN